MKLNQALLILVLLLTTAGLQGQQLHSYEPHDDGVECVLCAHAQQNQSNLAANQHQSIAESTHWFAAFLWRTDATSPQFIYAYQGRAPPENG